MNAINSSLAECLSAVPGAAAPVRNRYIIVTLVGFEFIVAVTYMGKLETDTQCIEMWAID